MMNKQKWLIYLAVVFTTVSIIGSVYFISKSKQDFGKLTITGPSKTMTYQIGGGTYTGPQQDIKVMAGKYTIKFSDKYYIDKAINLVVKKNQTTTYFVLLEQDNSSTGPGSALKFEEVANKLGDLRADEFIKNFPVTTTVPYHSDYFQIENYSVAENKIVLKVNLLTDRGKSVYQIKKLYSDYLKSIGQAETVVESEFFLISQVNQQTPE